MKETERRWESKAEEEERETEVGLEGHTEWRWEEKAGQQKAAMGEGFQVSLETKCER